ncbi:hypothetical protein B0H11DRAFT_1913660 [Mycena galericulata]|nr:hypothetical protein B0H11DRAFT_1913660 [Mycena galericulata]
MIPSSLPSFPPSKNTKVGSGSARYGQKHTGCGSRHPICGQESDLNPALEAELVRLSPEVGINVTDLSFERTRNRRYIRHPGNADITGARDAHTGPDEPGFRDIPKNSFPWAAELAITQIVRNVTYQNWTQTNWSQCLQVRMCDTHRKLTSSTRLEVVSRGEVNMLFLQIDDAESVPIQLHEFERESIFERWSHDTASPIQL